MRQWTAGENLEGETCECSDGVIARIRAELLVLAPPSWSEVADLSLFFEATKSPESVSRRESRWDALHTLLASS